MSFPSSHQWLADLSGHLTPRTLRGELAKLARDGFPVLLYHSSPPTWPSSSEELSRGLQLRRALARARARATRFTF